MLETKPDSSIVVYSRNKIKLNKRSITRPGSIERTGRNTIKLNKFHDYQSSLNNSHWGERDISKTMFK